MLRNQARVEFNIWGAEFDPHVVTTELGIKPDHCWMKGDKVRPHIPATHREARWAIVTDDEEWTDVNTQVLKILDRLDIPSKMDTWEHLRTTYQLTYQFVVVLSLREDPIPGMLFSERCLQQITQIHAEFAIYSYMQCIPEQRMRSALRAGRIHRHMRRA